MIPEACPSSSSVGPSPVLSTGMKDETATAEMREVEKRDPLDLTFVDCSASPGKDFRELENKNKTVVPPATRSAGAKSKRKAKVSPGTPSNENKDRIVAAPGNASVSRGKRRLKKKRACILPERSLSPSGGSSSENVHRVGQRIRIRV